MKKSPIIFCHYGNSKYLQYVFKCVKISNPDTEIFLLGDSANQEVAKNCGIKHIDFVDYDYGEDLKTFDQVYQLITTDGFDSHKHGEDWNKFVFRKWFVLANFVVKNQIGRFWHFDSDNMIFTDLSTLENRYLDLDFTEQCTGSCPKGFFNNNKTLVKYCQKINELFMRQDLMEETKRHMIKKKLGGCFSEMSVYEIFKKEEKFKTIRLSRIEENSSFDDLICRGDGLKMEKLPFGEDVKVVHLNPDGRFFAIEEKTGKPVEMHALNFSWIPIYVYNAVLKHFKKNHRKSRMDFIPTSKTLAQIPVPLKQKFKKYRKIFKEKFKN